MTDYSKADLRNRALADIGVLEAGEAASPEMVAYCDPICQQMIEGLDDENCLIFDPSLPVSTAVVPGRIMQPMTDLLAALIRSGFGRPKVTVQEWQMLLNALRRHVLQGSDPIPVAFSAF